MLGETVVSVAPASALPEEVVLLASESSGADSNLDVVDLASDQFEADMEEAVLKSLEDGVERQIEIFSVSLAVETTV